MKKELPLYELTLENLDIDSITAMSIVDFPAVEENFIALNKQNKIQLADESKHIITGVALIPDKKIYRKDVEGNEFEVFFSAQTIELIAKLFLKQHRQDNITIQHESNANNIYVFESWIVEDSDKDKSNALGLGKFPKGTWLISMKVENAEIWSDIKEGNLNGFSIEAYVSKMLTNSKIRQEANINNFKEKEEMKEEQKTEKTLLDKIVALFESEKGEEPKEETKQPEEVKEELEETPDYMAMITALEERIAAIETALTDEKAKNEELEKENEELSKEKEEVKKEVENVKKEKEELSKQVEELEKEPASEPVNFKNEKNEKSNPIMEAIARERKAMGLNY